VIRCITRLPSGLWRMANVKLIKHEAGSDNGSSEIQFDDGTPSKWFYWNDIASRRLRTEKVDRRQALQQAQAYARAARDRP
jgi:hypothetical protein